MATLQMILKDKAIKFHQYFYERCSDWNEYNNYEHEYFKDYITFAFFETDCERTMTNNNSRYVNLYQNCKNKDLVDEIFKQAVNRNKRNILCTVLYIFTCNPKSLKDCNPNQLNDHISIYSVLKVKKQNSEDENPCIIYIDEKARVYKSWKNYLMYNQLPACIMYIPKHGKYQANLRETWSIDSSVVWLDYRIKNTAITDLCESIDVASNYVNIALSGLGIASIFLPMTGVLWTGATVGRCITGIWNGGKALYTLKDRATHCQSISPTNKQAFMNYLGIFDTVCAGAETATFKLISKSARSGTTISKSIKVAHDTAILGTIISRSALIIGNSVDMIKKWSNNEDVSLNDIFSLSLNLFFFYNSVASIQLSSEIILSDQKKIIQEYKKSICDKKNRRAYARLVRKARKKVKGDVKQNEEIIRSLTKLNNKEEFLSSRVVSERNTVSAINIKLPFSTRRLHINNNPLIDIVKFISMLKNNSVINNQLSILNKLNIVRLSTIQSISTATLKLNSEISSERIIEEILNQTNGLLQDLFNISNIYEVIRDFDARDGILKSIIDKSLKIIQKRFKNIYSKYIQLDQAVGFVWKYLHANLLQQNCDFKIIKEFEPIIGEAIKRVIENIERETEKWISSFQEYLSLELHFSENNDESFDPNFIRDLMFNSEESNSRIELINVVEKWNPPITDVTKATNNVIRLFQSKLFDRSLGLDEDLIKLYISEAILYFLEHPREIHFEFKDIQSDVAGIVKDISRFDRKDIIFYKLVHLAVFNIKNDKSLTKSRFVNSLRFIWLFVILQINELSPGTKITDDNNEALIIKIILAIYHNQIEEPQKWLQYFTTYEVYFK